MPRGSRSGSKGRSSPTGNKPAPPKGQVRNGKAVQYAVKNPAGETTYIGTTNNPARRAAQHQQSGKMQPADCLKVQTKPTTRSKAESVESAKLRAHRKANGQNPQHNKTNDGRYHKQPASPTASVIQRLNPFRKPR